MLVLSRKINQSIMIGDDVRIVIVAVDRDQVKLGIEAPRAVSVHRSEIYEEIQRSNRAAAAAPATAAAATATPVGRPITPSTLGGAQRAQAQPEQLQKSRKNR